MHIILWNASFYMKQLSTDSASHDINLRFTCLLPIYYLRSRIAHGTGMSYILMKMTIKNEDRDILQRL